ncbi:replication protein A 70 kDa DNA-binding subunit [Chrysoperla carnea]|uniref:replication protein A 70 kDa DNA-binding subunit n=1 Tax=Chrysoperla carnea TaxID=189513 RepID=UPI001D08679A|nr:replication protein A 70 kDa DNA-binding subunit [Chrysoperla carnea]
MSNIKLTDGILMKIMRGDQVENPVVQVLYCKKIQKNDSNPDRYRLLLSDGRYMINFAMLASQVTDLVADGSLTNNAVIVVKRYITTKIQSNGKNDNRRVLLILELDILAKGEDIGMKLGNPMNLTAEIIAEADKANSSKLLSEKTNGNASNTWDKSPNKPASNTSMQTSMNTTSNSTFNPNMCHPIEALSPYNSKWVLKVRVMNKSSIRTWSNSKGEGKLFSMDVCDETGEIRITGFRDEVDKFYDMIQTDRIYYITGGQIKLANKQYSTLKNDYEITLNRDTEIVECHETTNVPTVSFKFVPIKAIATLEPNSIVDVIGVCKEAGECVHFNSRAGKALIKREIQLVDESQCSINLTLWGKEAEDFDGSSQPVIAIKGAKINEFMGSKSISGMSSPIRINPDIPEAYKLRGWYDNEGSKLDNVTNISGRSTTGDGYQSTNSPLMTFREVKAKHVTDSLSFSNIGTIMLIKSDRAVYKSCPAEGCNKKLLEMGDDSYRCDKCGKEYNDFQYRLLVSMNVADHTGESWMTVFASEAEKILGKTSQEMGEWLNNDKKEATEYIATKNFSKFMFRCRSRMDTYNDENRMKTVAFAAEPINHVVVNKYYLDKIKELTGIQKKTSNGMEY